MNEVERISDLYRPAAERRRDFAEVERPLTDGELHEQSGRCMNCGIPFCHGAGCPLGNVIPEMNAAVHAGDWRTAWEILSATSSFPEFTARVCPALCEGACVSGIHREPVMVRQLEKAIVETAFARGWVVPPAPAAASGFRAAVIGAGPSGLAAADALCRAGHAVTVYERQNAPGGLLRYGIPDFKLAKQVIDRRIGLMTCAGVRFEFGCTVGADLSAAYLARRFDAVVVAIGTPAARDLRVPGRELDGVHFALDYLGGQNRVNAGEYDRPPIDADGKDVVVIGGGDTGSDCVGTALRQHAKSVLQIELMPMPPLERSRSTPWPQWPYLLRTSSSQREGGERRWGLQTRELLGRDGRVAGVRTVKLDWAFSPTGRPLRFTEIPGSEEIVPADLVLLAMGFTGVPPGGLVTELELELSSRGALTARPDRGIFVAGDAASGASLVVRAIADGRRAAADANAFFKTRRPNA